MASATAPAQPAVPPSSERVVSSCGCGRSNDAPPPPSLHLPPVLARFERHVELQLERCQRHAAAGGLVAGIMCEFAPRELILAAGGIPVCLCGGSAATIPVAEEDLPATLCPLIKSSWGFHRSGGNPFLEMARLVVCETTCDGKTQMYQQLAATRPVHLLDLPRKVGEEAARLRWRAACAALRTALEDLIGRAITEDDLRAAIALMERERAALRGLADLMARDLPPLSGLQLGACRLMAAGDGADLAALEDAARALAAAPPNPAFQGRVRVLLTGTPHPHGMDKVLRLIEDAGGLVVAQESCTGLKPLVVRADPAAADPLAAIADAYLALPCAVLADNLPRRFALLRELVARYRPRCVIDCAWQGCTPYEVEGRALRRAVEGELGLPYLAIGTDYGPADAARLTLRLEALFETVG